LTADAPGLARGGGWLNSGGGGARPHETVADEPQKSSVILGCTSGRCRFEARDRTSPVDDQHRGAALQAVDQSAEVAFGFTDTSLFI
jgi:hypothetical protein